MTVFFISLFAFHDNHLLSLPMGFKVVMLLLSEEPNTWFRRIDDKLHQLTAKREQQAGFLCA
jgi:hypothetical protein